MRRWSFAAAGLAGAALLAFLIPLYDAPEPRGLNVTRGRVREIADAEARKWGIEVDKAFVVTILDNAYLLDKEFQNKPDLRRRADLDPVLGPRLFGFRVTYWRNGVEKSPPFGDVVVSRTGQVLAARRPDRPRCSDVRSGDRAGVRHHRGMAQAEGDLRAPAEDVPPSRARHRRRRVGARAGGSGRREGRAGTHRKAAP